MRVEVLQLQRRVRILGSIVRLLLALLRVSGFKLDSKSLAEDHARARLLRAVERARGVLPLRAVLRVLRISSSRYHAWVRQERGCELLEHTTCPRAAPNQFHTCQSLEFPLLE